MWPKQGNPKKQKMNDGVKLSEVENDMNVGKVSIFWSWKYLASYFNF